jgi:phage shock protein PspC (stress-responsive transcriptional regulator)
MMTDTHTTREGAPDRDDRLERPVEGRVIAGVAQGLSERLGITPGWVRLGFVIAALFGGSGILAYLAGWLLMPDEREDEPIAARYIGTVGNWSSWVGVALIGSATLLLIDRSGLISGDLLFAGVLVALGVLLYNGQLGGGTRDDAPEPTDSGGVDTDEPSPSDLPLTEGDEAGEPPAAAATFAGPEFDNPDFDPGADGIAPLDDGGSQAPPPPPPVQRPVSEPKPRRPRREPSYLGRFTIATALLVVGGLAAYDAGTTADVAYGVYMASFMIVIGAGLLVGAWAGRARWLIIPGLILLPVFVVASVLPGQLRGDIGERNVSGVEIVQAGGSDEMAIGHFRVDLRDLRDVPEGTVIDLDVSLGLGKLELIIPRERNVEVRAEVGIGELRTNRDSSGGVGIDQVFVFDGVGLDETRVFGTGQPDLIVRADLGIGQILVRQLGPAGVIGAPGVDCRPSSVNWPFDGELICERTG